MASESAGKEEAADWSELVPNARAVCGELTVGRVGQYAAQTHPDKLAIEDAGLRLSYRELDARVARMASGLCALGLVKGDVVSAYLPNCLSYVLVVLAAARAGVIFSPLNPRFKTRELTDILGVARPRAIFTEVSRLDVVGEALGRAAHSATIITVDGAKDGSLSLDQLLESRPCELPAVAEDDFFSLMFTSGTTGKPKGALATHRARMLWVLNAAILYGLTSSDVYLGTMPQVHSAGLTFTLMHLYAGGTVQILRDFDARDYLSLVESKRVTSSLMVPTMLAMVLEEIASSGRRYDLSSLKRMVTCGSPLQPAVKERVLKQITDQLYDYYGSTESNSMTVLLPRDQMRKPTSVGQAFPNVKLRVLGEDGNERPAGQAGEIWCRNPSVMTGYFRQPEATASVFRDGWYRTGDLGYLDEDAYLYLVGRSVDVIISGGVNIYPAEIEQVIMEHPAVLDCAVVGEPDAKWGQRVAAYLVLRPGRTIDLAELQRHCSGLIADYKKPRSLTILPEIPKNAGGKTVKSALVKATPNGA